MFLRLGKAVVDHPWRVILCWVVLGLAVVALAPGLSTNASEEDFLPRHYEVIKAIETQERLFPEAASPSAIGVFTPAVTALAGRRAWWPGNADPVGPPPGPTGAPASTVSER